MSLVICKTFGKAVRFESDTRGWNSLAAMKEAPFDGYLKVLILKSDLCIAWAGDVETARSAVAEMHTLIRKDVGVEILYEALAVYSGSNFAGTEADFIVAQAGSTPSVFRVCNGQVELSQGSTWIGDSDAFSYFQSIWIDTVRLIPNQEERMKEFDTAFDKTLVAASIDTVGDFRISAGARNDEFKYLAYGKIQYPRQTIYPTETQFFLRDRADGGYGVSCLTAKVGSKPGCALYFMPAGFGVFLLPEKPFDFGKLLKLPFRDFLRFASKKHKLELEGVEINQHGQITNIGSQSFEVSISTHTESGDDTKLYVHRSKAKPGT